MAQDELVVRLAGTAGEGVISAGDVFTLASARSGFNVTTNQTFSAEIKGGGNTMFQVRVAEKKLLTAGEEADILFVTNTSAFEENKNVVKKNGIVLYDLKEDQEDYIPDSKDYIKYAVPISTIADKQVAMPKSKNMVALGILCGLIPNNNIQDQIKSDIAARFKRKGEQIISKNIEAFDIGFDYSNKKIDRQDCLDVVMQSSEDGKLIMTGNEAMSFGALVAGCRFYAGYPITPATSIMEWLARELPKFGGCVIQAEDEIAAITMAIGASYAGKKAFTATSGPGLSLMSEAIGLASMAEIPLVIANIQRGGPSTGLPTKTEQSDLSQAIYGTHGDAPKIVLAPINVMDCFYQTINAFNLAEKYQVPVIILSDFSLANKRESVEKIDLDNLEIFERIRYDAESSNGNYSRYQMSYTGVSPMSIPGDRGGMYVATGLEHNETGSPNFSPLNHTKMTEKRFGKLESSMSDFHQARTYGYDNTDIGIISWGSTSGAVLEAIDIAKDDGVEMQAIYPKILYPFPDAWIHQFIKDKKKLFIVERNYTGQFANVIVNRCLGYKELKVYQIKKYDGEPFTAEEVYKKIKEHLNNGQ